MYESNVRCQFMVPGGKVVTEKLFGFPIIPDDTIVTQDVVAVGFDCGAPPEPSVKIIIHTPFWGKPSNQDTSITFPALLFL